jgi:succinylglutamate desuccinylase
MKLPKRVLIFGGTHGNEWTGIFLINNYRDYFINKYPELNLEFILANPEAYRLNKRFKDEDLNRAFQYLDQEKDSFENKRAQELKALIDQEECLIVDLHTTTANMGNTVIVSHYNEVNFTLCSQVTKDIPGCKVIAAPDPNKKYLASQSSYGLILEVGPVANGVLSAHCLEATIALLDSLLKALTVAPVPVNQLDVYEEAYDVHYPVNAAGDIEAYIHANFQGRDFSAQQGEFTCFRTFDGKDLTHRCEEKLFPIFINEAAYYQQHLAFSLCRLKKLHL